uniref:Uncharacterized protein n=1 Tax=Oryza sativa subsp. japonica TaxID=39947 RepID=Q84NX6_ORYSJ|nr:hypothetical protein [Oryza sativa Japonica Group]
MGRRPIPSFLPLLLAGPAAGRGPARPPAALLSRGRRQVGPTCRVLPPPPAAPGAPPRPRLRLLRAMSTTPARAPRLPRPFPSLSRPRPRPRPRWPGFDFRIPPLSPPPLPHVARRFPPLPATSGPLSPYLSIAVVPSHFFPISPHSLEPPIAPAPCNPLPPPFPLLRPPLAAVRVAARPRRRRRRVRVAEIHPVHPSSVDVRRRSPRSLALGAPRSSSARRRRPPVACRRRSPSSSSAPAALDSDSSDAPVYFEIVAEVPPAAEQGNHAFGYHAPLLAWAREGTARCPLGTGVKPEVWCAWLEGVMRRILSRPLSAGSPPPTTAAGREEGKGKNRKGRGRQQGSREGRGEAAREGEGEGRGGERRGKGRMRSEGVGKEREEGREGWGETREGGEGIDWVWLCVVDKDMHSGMDKHVG